MNFSERQLVDLFCNSLYFMDYIPFGWQRSTEIETEFELNSGKRIDILVNNRDFRVFNIIECKIVAEPSAITQACDYLDEAYSSHLCIFKRNLSMGYVTIAAQFFRKDTLFFAKHMGIGCVLISPINEGQVALKTILPVNKKRQLSLKSASARLTFSVERSMVSPTAKIFEVSRG